MQSVVHFEVNCSQLVEVQHDARALILVGLERAVGLVYLPQEGVVFKEPFIAL